MPSTKYDLMLWRHQLAMCWTVDYIWLLPSEYESQSILPWENYTCNGYFAFLSHSASDIISLHGLTNCFIHYHANNNSSDQITNFIGNKLLQLALVHGNQWSQFPWTQSPTCLLIRIGWYQLWGNTLKGFYLIGHSL